MTWGGDRHVDTVQGIHGTSPGPDLKPPEKDPGKVIPTASLPSKAGVGDPYIDHGAACDADATASDCFLDAAVRDRLVREYQQRTLAAETHCLSALTDLRVDELLKKDDSDPGWVVGLIISMATGYVGTLIGNAAKVLAGLNTAQRAAKLSALGPTRPITAAFTVERQIDALMSNLGGTARAYAIPAVGKADVASKAKDHQRVASFIDQLKDSAATFYQQLREGPVGTANDEMLTALWHGMDEANGHRSSQYKVQFAQVIDRFKNSRASWVGQRDSNFEDGKPVGDNFEDISFSRSRSTLTTRLAWLTRLSNKYGAAKLCYFDDRTTASLFGERAPEFDEVQPVEPEFMQVAIDRHTVAFGSPPGALIIDDRDPSNSRVVVNPFSGGHIPKLQLDGGK